MSLKRRQFLRRLGATAAVTALPGGILAATRRVGAQPSAGQRFLFVISASGGASIIDSFLPVVDSEAGPAGQRLVAYPEAAIGQPAGSNIRCVRNLNLGGIFSNDYDVYDFLAAHKDDMAIVTVENTSVNHVVAQKRAITGAGIDGGRTLMEAMAMQHGDGLLLPNCNMGSGGYLEPGELAVPERVRAEIITDPTFFAVSTHGTRGVPRAPGADVLARARAAREQLDDLSPFAGAHVSSRLRQRYLELRRNLAPNIESADLITKLMLVQESPEIPLSDYDLDSSPDGAELRIQFPRLGVDKLQTQAALAFLLAKYGVACALTFGPSFAPNFLPDGSIIDTPIAFDFSHNDHVTTQNTMWSRIMESVDGLIRLLKSTPHGEGTMWDSSLVYIATDFGRSKERPAGSLAFGSGHHLNNGNVLISPLLRGNAIYGGIEPTTALTYGFDPATGDPVRDEVMREGHLYSLVCQAMGIDFDGRYDMSGLLR